jgi:hypothetical protein
MPNTPIAITFSEPMNLENLKAAFSAKMAVSNGQFKNLPVSAVTVDEGTNTYSFSVPLEHTAEVVWVINGLKATDLAGNKLGANALGQFFTMKRGYFVLTSSAALDGYYACCDVGISGGYNVTSSTIKVGFGTKSSVFERDERVTQGYLSFDFSGLPRDLVQIVDSTLILTKDQSTGTPFLEHGDMTVLRVNYPGGLNGDLASKWRCESQSDDCRFKIKSEDESQFNVAAIMRKNWAERANLSNRAQFQLFFIFNPNKQGKDFIEYHSGDSTTVSARPKLIVTVLYP